MQTNEINGKKTAVNKAVYFICLHHFLLFVIYLLFSIIFFCTVIYLFIFSAAMSGLNCVFQIGSVLNVFTYLSCHCTQSIGVCSVFPLENLRSSCSLNRTQNISPSPPLYICCPQLNTTTKAKRGQSTIDTHVQCLF